MSSSELPTRRQAGAEYRSCEWCGEAVSQLGSRSPRLYCKRSHRQRAFEARRLGRPMQRDRDQVQPVVEVEAPVVDDAESELNRRLSRWLGPDAE